LTNSNWILYRANSAISKAFGFEIRIKIVTLHIPPFVVTITVSFLLHIPFLFKLTISYTTHISTRLKYKYFCKVIMCKKSYWSYKFLSGNVKNLVIFLLFQNPSLSSWDFSPLIFGFRKEHSDFENRSIPNDKLTPFFTGFWK